jgi:hypothetical protein
MPDVILKLAEEHASKTKEEISRIFDEEVERFSRYMATIGDWRAVGVLNNGERMLIKTFLVQKFSGNVDNRTSPEGR